MTLRVPVEQTSKHMNINGGCMGGCMLPGKKLKTVVMCVPCVVMCGLSCLGCHVGCHVCVPCVVMCVVMQIWWASLACPRP